MKYLIELSESELHLINKSLDLYSRLSILQFRYLKDIPSIANRRVDHDLLEERFNLLSNVFGYSLNSGPGIFNRKEVTDDAIVAYDIYQTIRHFLYLERGDTSVGTVDAYPNNACSIAKIPIPEFKIKKNEI